ncbi:MAG: hypothetical protein SPM02_03160, partial [Bacteroidales bacterium]|nr:hypothetical protein [Bacteroidales bacterium]
HNQQHNGCDHAPPLFQHGAQPFTGFCRTALGFRPPALRWVILLFTGLLFCCLAAIHSWGGIGSARLFLLPVWAASCPVLFRSLCCGYLLGLCSIAVLWHAAFIQFVVIPFHVNPPL